jgi:hypothetical protein
MSPLVKISGIGIIVAVTIGLVYIGISPSFQKQLIAQPEIATHSNRVKPVIPPQSVPDILAQDDSQDKHDSILYEDIQPLDTEEKVDIPNESALALNDIIVIDSAGNIVSSKPSVSGQTPSTLVPASLSSTSASSGSFSSETVNTGTSGASGGSFASSGGGFSGGGSSSSGSGSKASHLSDIDQDIDDLLNHSITDTTPTETETDDNSGQQSATAISPGLNFAYLNSANFKLEKVLPLMKSLPKPHFSNGVDGDLLNSPDSLITYHLARVMNGVSFWGAWVSKRLVYNSVYICNKVNITNPKIPCSISITYEPWHYKFGSELPVTDRGEAYEEEIRFCQERLSNIKTWIKEANQLYKCNVKVSNIANDMERFNSARHDNDALCECLDEIHILQSSIFPEARIIWFGRGYAGRHVVFPLLYWTGNEITDCASCELYTPHEIDIVDETFRQTCIMANQKGFSEINPYVSLGAGFVEGADGVYSWTHKHDYDLQNSYDLGERLNRKTFKGNLDNKPDYSMLKYVIFYPSVMNKRAPYWPKHFAAYVMGATANKISE